MTFFSATCTVLSTVLLWSLTPFAEVIKIIGDRQCEFLRHGSTTGHIFCIRQTLGKIWEYNEAVHQLFID